jgi:hypothetical protein
MPRLTFLALLSISSATALAFALKEDDPSLLALPASFTGAFDGTLKVYSADGKLAQEVPMRIEVEPGEPGGAQPFRLIYGDPTTASPRDYEMTPVAGSANHFVHDEKNGILLDTYLVGESLYSQFEISGVRIDSRFRLEGDDLVSEMVTFGVTAERDSRPSGDSTTVVRSYPLRGVQLARLKRSK